MIRPQSEPSRGTGDSQRSSPRQRRAQRSGDASFRPRQVAADVGRFLRRTREAQRLSQEQLAALTGRRASPISRAMISAVERGRHLPGLEVLLTLSQVLHISPNEILERIELARCAGSTAIAEQLSAQELLETANGLFWTGRYGEAVAHFDALLARIDAEPAREPVEQALRVARVEIPRAAALRRSGASSAARAAAERAIALAEGAPGVQAEAYVVVVALLVQQGCLPLARDLAARAVELARESAEPRVQGRAWIEMGETLAASGQKAEACQAFRRALRYVRRAGDSKHAIHVEGNIGACLFDLGRFSQARARYRRALGLARKIGVPASEALWLVELGRVAARRGELDEADARFAAALRIAKPAGFLLTAFRAEWHRHLIQRRRSPADRDRHRVAHLKRLFVRLTEYRGIDEVEEFRRVHCARRGRDGAP